VSSFFLLRGNLFKEDISLQNDTDLQDIEYQVIFDGFVELDDPSSEIPLGGDLFVFNSEEQWENFAQKYFSKLPSFLRRLDISIDFTKQKLICKPVMPTHEDYNRALIVDNVILVDNTLVMRFSQDKLNTYVLGSSDKRSVFFTWYLQQLTILNKSLI